VSTYDLLADADLLLIVVKSGSDVRQ